MDGTSGNGLVSSFEHVHQALVPRTIPYASRSTKERFIISSNALESSKLSSMFSICTQPGSRDFPPGFIEHLGLACLDYRNSRYTSGIAYLRLSRWSPYGLSLKLVLTRAFPMDAMAKLQMA